MILVVKPKMCASGKRDHAEVLPARAGASCAESVTVESRLWLVSIAPLGKPVVPEV